MFTSVEEQEESRFAACIKQAIRMGRKYMIYPPVSENEVTKQEWELALLLYKDMLNGTKNERSI